MGYLLHFIVMGRSALLSFFLQLFIYIGYNTVTRSSEIVANVGRRFYVSLI